MLNRPFTVRNNDTKVDAHIDSLMWIPKNEVDVLRIKSDLTVATFDFNGNPDDLIMLYDDVGDFIGVPRRWGLAKFGDKFNIVNNTSQPRVEWPDPTWEEGSGYWAGQKDSINNVLSCLKSSTVESYGCLLEAPCGAGKTLMALSVAAALNTPALVLVHKGDLAKQWHDLCLGTDKRKGLWPSIKVGHVQQDKCDYKGCHLVTAMAQTIHSRIDKLPSDFFKSFGLVIYDEGHRYPARTFERVMRLPTARWRLGISATWRRSDKLECVWNWHIGPVVSRAIVARLSGEYNQVSWSTHLSDSLMKGYGGQLDRNKWLAAITSNVSYNHWLVSQIIKSQIAGRKVLVASDRVQHCKVLYNLLRTKAAEDGLSFEVGLYIGEMKEDKLEVSKKCDVIIATYPKMSEGTDIPELDTLFLVTPRTDVEQIVGRIQRVVAGKKPLLVIDPVFTSQYNKRMADKRRLVYERLGFKKQEISNGK